MKIKYMLAFLGGVELMALANALSLGLLPCRFLALIFLLVALAAAGMIGYSACYKHLRKAVDQPFAKIVQSENVSVMRFFAVFTELYRIIIGERSVHIPFHVVDRVGF